MEYIHVKNLNKYHPGYTDRTLQWAKIYFKVVQGDPDCELIDNEIDFARLIKFILLELQAQQPLPLDERYLTKKGFDLKIRPISLTLQMLHNFIITVRSKEETCNVDKDKYKEYKEEEYKEDKYKEDKNKTRDIYITPLKNKKPNPKCTICGGSGKVNVSGHPLFGAKCLCMEGAK